MRSALPGRRQEAGVLLTHLAAGKTEAPGGCIARPASGGAELQTQHLWSQRPVLHPLPTPKWEQRASTQPPQAGKTLSGGVLVCSGSHNKLPRTGRLKQQRYIFSVWEASAPGSRCGPSGLGSGESALVGSQVAAFRPLPHMASCLWGQRESLGVSSPSFRDTSSIISGPHAYKLI